MLSILLFPSLRIIVAEPRFSRFCVFIFVGLFCFSPLISFLVLLSSPPNHRGRVSASIRDGNIFTFVLPAPSLGGVTLPSGGGRGAKSAAAAGDTHSLRSLFSSSSSSSSSSSASPIRIELHVEMASMGGSHSAGVIDLLLPSSNKAIQMGAWKDADIKSEVPAGLSASLSICLSQSLSVCQSVCLSFVVFDPHRVVVFICW